MWWWSWTPALAGGTLSVDSLSVDGLELRAMSCTLDQQLLLGPVTVAAALASQKAALDACAPGGEAFQVTFQWASPPSATVDRASAKSAAPCVQKALAAVAPPVAGTCTVVVLTGPTPAAEAARERMQGLAP